MKKKTKKLKSISMNYDVKEEYPFQIKVRYSVSVELSKQEAITFVKFVNECVK